MSTRAWRFEPLEFVVLWEQFRVVPLPYPLQYRAEAALAVDHHRDRRTAAAAVIERLDDDLYRAVAVLAEPDTTVSAYGLDDIGRYDEKVVRAHVGIRGRAATIAVQWPGHSEDAGGMVDLTLVGATEVPAKLAATLPKRRPGKGDTLVAHPNELTDGPLLADASATNTRERLKTRLAKPRRCAGEVTVCRGRATTPTGGFAWHDYDDGRYLVEHAPGGTATIRPGPTAAVAMCIRTALNGEPQKEQS